MEYVTKDSFVKNNQAIISIKQQILDFSQKEMANLRSLINSVDHHIVNQSSKQHFQAFTFNQQSQLAFSDLQTYYTRLMVKMTEFPCLADLAKTLQYFITQSIKLHTFTNECWFARVRQLQTSNNNSCNSQPPMEVCLKCSENIRHQEIKQAKFNISNLIDDPYLFYQKQTTKNSRVYEEIVQKSIQDKLSQLARDLQFEQICMRELIQNLTIQSKQLRLSNLTHQNKGELQFIPILKQMAKHVRAQIQRKVTSQIGIQTIIPIINNSTSNNLIHPQLKEFDQNNNSKIACELSNKIKEIKNLQQKLQQENKIANQFRTQLSVLRQDQNNLQKRNSELEIEVNCSNKQQKYKKISEYKANFTNISPTTPMNLQAIHELNANIQKQSQINESKYELKNKKKSQLLNTLKKSINLTSMVSYMQNAKRVFRKTQNLFNFEESSKSIQKNQYNQEDEISDQFESQLPRIFSNNSNLQLKQTQRRDQLLDLKSLNSSTLDFAKQFSQSKVRKSNKLNKSQNKNQSRVSNIQHKSRRIGAVYDKQSLLKMLYRNELNDNQSSIDYEHFKKNYENLMQKLLGKPQISTKQNTKQQLYTRQQKKDSSQKKKLTRHIQKKSTVSIRSYLRNQQISRNSSENKVTHINQLQEPTKELTKQQRKIINQLKIMLATDQQIQQKRTVLNKQEHSLVTEFMAYLVQLKVKNKLVYKQLKEVICYFQKYNKNCEKEQKEIVQMRTAQLIKNHRTCKKLNDNNYCSHIKTLLFSIIQLIE